MKRLISITAVLILLGFTPLFATDYYVSNAGDDEATGLIGFPWETINKVNDEMGNFNADDNIYFNRGDEWQGAAQERLEITCSGTSGHHITFGAYGTGALPIINGSTVETTWVKDSDVGELDVYVKNFTNDVGVIVEDDTYIINVRWDTDVATTFGSASLGSWAYNSGTNNAYVVCTDNADPDTHTMEVGAKADNERWAARILNGDYLTIENLEFRYATSGGLRARITVDNTIHLVNINDCIFRMNGERGFESSDAIDDGVCYMTFTIEDCDALYNGNHGFYFGGETKNSVIRRCEAHYNGWTRLQGDSVGGHGISSWANNDTARPHDNIIEYCIASNTEDAHDEGEGNGIQADDYTLDCIYRYNISYDNQGSGFTDHPTADGGSNQWYYIISYGNGQHGFYVHTAPGCLVYNSVFYGNTDDSINIWSADSSGVIIKNNIIFESSAQEIKVAATVPVGSPVSDYNCIYHSGGGTFMDWKGDDYDWADWKTNSSQDGNSLNEDPHVINAAGDDFRLLMGSPCINAGTDVSLTRDYLGILIRHAPDIGAYENQTNAIFYPPPPDLEKMRAMFLRITTK